MDAATRRFLATALKIASVVLLFAACLALQLFIFPSARLAFLTALDIVPIALVALFWGLAPGIAAGVVATLSIIAIEAAVYPAGMLEVVIMGTLFYVGAGALLGRMSDLARSLRQRTHALEQTTARLNTVLETAQDAVITIDSEGRITSWNAAAERMFGWSRQEMIGRDLHSIVAAPSYQEAGAQQLPRFPRPDEERTIQTTMIELEGVRRGGETFPAELSLGTFVEDGRRHAVGIVRDITERKTIQERYRRLFETVPVGLYRTSSEGVILDVNPAMVEVLGFPDRATLVARNAASFYEDLREREELLRRAAREGTVHMEVRLLRYDGSPIDCVMSVRVSRDAAGAVLWFEGSVRDMTEQRRAEAARRRSERLESVGQLAAGVAHDLNNILAGIRGFAEFRTGRSDAASSDSGRRIIQAVGRADRIIDALAAVLGGQVHRPAAVSLEQIVSSALRGLDPSCAGIVDRQHAEGPVDAFADAEAVATVVRELVENAVRASPPGSRVVVRTGTGPAVRTSVLAPAGSHAGPWAWLEVTDSGSGMDPRTVDRLFEPYFTSQEFGTGAGLGLVRVLGIVRQHGGGIDVDSTAGRGTTVRVFLPPAGA